MHTPNYMEIGKKKLFVDVRTDGRTDTRQFQSTRSSVGDDLKIGERIKCKVLSLSYKAFTTTQPYVHNLNPAQPPRSTRSSSLVNLAPPPISSSLRGQCRSR